MQENNRSMIGFHITPRFYPPNHKLQDGLFRYRSVAVAAENGSGKDLNFIRCYPQTAKTELHQRIKINLMLLK